jgi:hypothetical protein
MGCLVCIIFNSYIYTHKILQSEHRARHLGVSNWDYGKLGDMVAIPVRRLSGTFALFDVQMTYGRYWVVVALDSMSPERDYEDED